MDFIFFYWQRVSRSILSISDFLSIIWDIFFSILDINKKTMNYFLIYHLNIIWNKNESFSSKKHKINEKESLEEKKLAGSWGRGDLCDVGGGRTFWTVTS